MKTEKTFWVVTSCYIFEKPFFLISWDSCLFDLTSDTAIRLNFETEKSISDFWRTLKNELKINPIR